jgi:hypothetical protein
MLLVGGLPLGYFTSLAGSVESTEDSEAWKRLIEHRIEEQAAGNNSALDETQPTWKEYWTAWYSYLSHHGPDGLFGKGSGFKSGEEMSRFIKERLKAHHLPTYDQT